MTGQVQVVNVGSVDENIGLESKRVKEKKDGEEVDNGRIVQ